MAASTQLKGIELINCARANAKQGLETSTQLCGYGDDQAAFQEALQDASQQMGIEVHDLSDLLQPPTVLARREGIEFSPDTQGNL